MARTREYKATVLARIKRDPKFAKALYAEAVSALLEGETDDGLSMLRDLVHAGITFKELSKQTGLGEKTLHRTLSRRGNPTTRNLFTVTKAICESLGIAPQFKFAAYTSGSSRRDVFSPAIAKLEGDQRGNNSGHQPQKTAGHRADENVQRLVRLDWRAARLGGVDELHQQVLRHLGIQFFSFDFCEKQFVKIEQLRQIPFFIPVRLFLR